ncbi:proton-coupled amino acid transporter-like protein pathetic [Episyrphus balteatus]|uniref:proton-coupled amino acid transporter-like protein pathetic n=1 Tax=Episyrphus balteatus TaxID=286459 RepID=UPI002485DED3|nr:proton-coupled amino acid transporter-like protein pathetic [Episyrphus balteatus]
MVNISDGGKNVPQEMEQFLPPGEKKAVIVYKMAADPEQGGEKGYDPFAERLTMESATTDNETLTHLLKAALGTGILSMPIAFMYAGLFFGIFTTMFTALVCTHCAYVLVKCGHKLYYKEQKSKMSFAEISEKAFMLGPGWVRALAVPSRILILFGLFLTYFGTCSVYAVIVAKNFQQIIEHYTKTEINAQILIAILLVPLILLTWIPNLKSLAPVSMAANVFMGCGLAITFYYLVIGLAPINEREYVQLSTLPSFFAITIFAMEAIGVIMPLENSMKTPQNFIGVFGVLSKGMSGVTLIYILLGFLGYLRFGNETGESITLNLPVEEVPAQIVKVLIALGVYCTFGLQFTVCLEIAWDGIKDNFTKRPLLANYVLRTVLVVASIVLAIAVPTIAPFMGLIGAFCFSILGLIMPAAIEIIMSLETGFGTCNWILWKNIFIFLFGIFALVFGSISAIKDILRIYT